MTDRRMAILNVSMEVLEAVLRLPEGHHIERVIVDSYDPWRTVAIVVEGPELPKVVAGQVLERLNPVYELHDGKTVFKSWHPEGSPARAFGGR